MKNVISTLPRDEAEALAKYKTFHRIVLINVMSREVDQPDEECRNHLRVARHMFTDVRFLFPFFVIILQYPLDGPSTFEGENLLPCMLDGGLHEFRRKFSIYVLPEKDMIEHMVRVYTKQQCTMFGLYIDKYAGALILAVVLMTLVFRQRESIRVGVRHNDEHDEWLRHHSIHLHYSSQTKTLLQTH